MAKQPLKTTSEEETKTPEQQLLEAIVNVMSEVEYLQKDDTVGTGASAYKGISDEKVRQSIRKSMIIHGLVCVPVGITTETKHDRWTEADPYSKTGGMKTKQQIFSDITFTFRLYHISGAYIEGQSTGHGVDSQDKAAGKAMTYAMKYFLLNTFMIPTGEDSDKTNSMDIPIPKTLDTKPEVIQVPKTTVVPEKLHPTFPTEEEVKTMLYDEKGILSVKIIDGVIDNWTRHGATLLYGKYIYSVDKTGKYNYFVVGEYNMPRVMKLVKLKHG